MSVRSVSTRRASRETCGPRQRTAQTQFSVENDRVRRFAGPPTGTTYKSQLRGSGSSAGREVISLCIKIGATVQFKVLMGAISMDSLTRSQRVNHGGAESRRTSLTFLLRASVSPWWIEWPKFSFAYLPANAELNGIVQKTLHLALIYKGQ